MAETVKAKSPETSNVSAPVAEVTVSEKLSNAIEKLAERGVPKPIRYGLTPTDPAGKPLECNAVFVDRDGAKYDAILEGKREIRRDTFRGGNMEDTRNWSSEKVTVYDARVNFQTKKEESWRPVFGIPELATLRNTYKKAYVILKG